MLLLLNIIINLIVGFNKYGVYSLFPGGPSLGSAIYSHSSTIAGRFTSGSIQPQTGGPFHTAHKSKYLRSFIILICLFSTKWPIYQTNEHPTLFAICELISVVLNLANSNSLTRIYTQISMNNGIVFATFCISFMIRNQYFLKIINCLIFTRFLIYFALTISQGQLPKDLKNRAKCCRTLELIYHKHFLTLKNKCFG